MKTTMNGQQHNRARIWRTTGLSCWVISLAIAMMLFGSFAMAQYTIPWWTSDSAGGNAANYHYDMIGSISQPDPQVLTGSGYTLYGGFLGGAAVAPPTRLAEYSFPSSPEGWTFAGAIPGYSTPGTISTGGHIGLNPLGSTNCFSYWYSPSITIQDNRVYRAQWLIGSSAATANTTVQTRMRINQIGSWQAWNRALNSNLNQAPYTGHPRWYKLFFDPDVTGSTDNKVQMSFDILSFDATDNTNSSLFLEEARIDEVTVSVGTQTKTYTFASSAEGWTFAGTIPPYNAPGTLVGNSHLAMNPLGSVNCFSYWGSPDIPIEVNKLYRAQFGVSSNNANGDDTVQFRVRVNQKAAWQAWDRGVNSNNGQAPSTSWKYYNVYFEPDVDYLGDDKITFSFDIMSFDPNDNENSFIYLENAYLNEVAINP